MNDGIRIRVFFFNSNLALKYNLTQVFFIKEKKNYNLKFWILKFNSFTYVGT